VKPYFAHRAKTTRPSFAVFDFETDGLGGPLIAASYKLESDEEATYINSGNIIQTLFEVMCENNNFTWYAHNVQYELLYFIEKMRAYDDRLEIFNRSDRDIFMIHFHIPEYGDGAKVIIKDSLALYPGTLKDFAKSFAPSLPKLDLDFNSETFDPFNPTHIAYSKRDSDSLLECLINFDAALFEHFGVHVGGTTAGTAMAAWEHSLGKDEKYIIHEIADERIRSAYFGGLVFLTDTNEYQGASTYDVNSSYPYQMLSHAVPVGKPMTTTKIETGTLGIYDVTVSAPLGLIIPILPVRESSGSIRWPTGIFRTSVTSCEIEFALSHGYKVLEVHSGLIWNNTAKPFTKFINKCREIRAKHKGTSFEILAKLMQNSLYGKFGAKKVRKKFYKAIDAKYDPLSFVPWGDFFTRTEQAESMAALPQWAVFITARARLLLLSHAYAIGPENVIYGDTDSLTLKPGFTLPTGSDYGQFKLEKSWLSFVARAPKVYAGKLLIDGKETYLGAVKGIPKKYWKEQGILEAVFLTGAGKLDYKTLERLVSSMKSGYVGEHDATRSISDIANSKSWRLLPDGRVRPKPYAQEADPLQETASNCG
jgi:hypothetical protein